ncbi:MAG TPA: hypothetical protein VLR89_09805 [Anaerolineaceae bacterium]|nr:hypothetical protein [Anaerolineaceae bacterium]
MRHRSLFSLVVILTLIFGLLEACTPAGDSLPLTDYQNPAGLYTLKIPKTWSSDYDEETSVLTLTPPDAKGTEGELRVSILVVPVTDPDSTVRLEQIKAYFQPFLESLIESDQEVINRGETTVNRMNAVLLDFGKPWQSSYLTGREVLVNSSTHAIAFVGTGEDQAWQGFLPTFRKILESFQLSNPEPTPLPGGFRP